MTEDRHEPPLPVNSAAGNALILGILSIVGGLTSLPGLIFGVIGLRRAKRLGGAGRGAAIAGIVMSVVGVAAAVWVYFAVQRVRDAAERSVATCHLKCIGLGIHGHSDTHDYMPSPYARNPEAPFVAVPESELTSKLSWRVSILPFIDQHHIQARMALDQPWDSPKNRPVAAHVVRTFTDPDAREDPDTRYRILYGPETVWRLDRPSRQLSITDGMSNTLFVVESGEKVTWTRCAEMRFDPASPPDPATMGRPKQGTFQTVMADGSVRTFRKTMDPWVLRAIITANGVEIIDLDGN